MTKFVLQSVVKVYKLSNLEDVVCDGDITALAHPSPISLGTSHGVYILPHSEKSYQPLVEMSPCLEVLQKPSLDKMRKRGAVVERDGGEEMIFSDGSFWLNKRTVVTLIDLYHVSVTSPSSMTIALDLDM